MLRLAGTGWGVDINTLRTATMTLVFATVAPVWSISAISCNTQINSVMLLISARAKQPKPLVHGYTNIF